MSATHVTADGRTFTLIGREPYLRKDGRQTDLAIWQGTCRLCGQPFTIKTPANPSGESNSFGVVHCAQHRLTREQATRLWLASMSKQAKA